MTATAVHPTPATKTRRGGRRSRFSAQDRRRLVERATLRLADGVSYRESAKEIGVCYETFRRWRLEQSDSSRLRPVRTKPTVPAVVSAPQSLRVVTAAGDRVEGLELVQVAELLRSLR